MGVHRPLAWKGLAVNRILDREFAVEFGSYELGVQFSKVNKRNKFHFHLDFF
jgi:hypothetical protein